MTVPINILHVLYFFIGHTVIVLDCARYAELLQPDHHLFFMTGPSAGLAEVIHSLSNARWMVCDSGNVV